MNERIQELALQAGINCVVPTEGTLEYAGKGEVEHLRKFALLIVRECVGLTDQWPDTVRQVMSRQIKTHFGVE